MKDEVRLTIMEICERSLAIIEEDGDKANRNESERLAMVATLLDVICRACELTSAELKEQAK